MEEENNSLLILYVVNAGTEGCNNFLILSKNTDLEMYLLAYVNQFKTNDIEKIRAKFGFKEDQHHLPF